MSKEKQGAAATEKDVKVESEAKDQKPVVEPDNPGEVEEEEDDDLSWLQDEEPDSSEDGDDDGDDDDDDDAGGKSGGVPVDKHIKIKQKLKGKLSEEKEENEKLKARIAELETAKKEPAARTLEKPKRPKRSEFDSDDDYDEAMEEYDEKLISFIPQAAASRAEQEEHKKAQVQEVKDAAEAHLDRAAKLIEKHGIDPDTYKSAQDNVKKIITAILPKTVPADKRNQAGEYVFNQFISMVGEGSEKTIFYIGKNKSASNEFERLMRSDPTGLKAAFYLGSVNTDIAGKKNLTSRASKPTSKLKGGGQLPANEASLKKQYQAAHKAQDGQKSYNLKQKAKKAGIDVSAW